MNNTKKIITNSTCSVKIGAVNIIDVGLDLNYDYYLSAFTYCSVRDLRGGKFEVTVGSDLSPYLKPTMTLAVCKPGNTGEYMTIGLEVDADVVVDGDFTLYSGVFKPHTDTNITLQGPANYSYRLLTNKVGDAVLDYEYVKPIQKWVKVGEVMTVRMIMSNGLHNPKLRFEYRCDSLPNNAHTITRMVNSQTHGGHYRVYNETNTSCIATKVGELKVKGADPLKTTNPYVAAVHFDGESHYSRVAPRLEDNNVSSTHNARGLTTPIQIVYGDIPHITLMKSGDRENICKGKTIYKNGKYKDEDVKHPLETKEGDVVMQFDGFGKIEGPVWVVLRKPDSATIWRKAKDTRIRIVGGDNLKISGGTLPSNIPKVYSDFLLGQTVIIDYVPKTGFVQST